MMGKMVEVSTPGKVVSTRKPVMPPSCLANASSSVTANTAA